MPVVINEFEVVPSRRRSRAGATGRGAAAGRRRAGARRHRAAPCSDAAAQRALRVWAH